MSGTTAGTMSFRMELTSIDLAPSPRIVAFATRRGVDGDCCREPYAGFNACHYVGDNPHHVARSRSMLAAELGVSVDRLMIPTQTHSCNVRVVTPQHSPEIVMSWPDTDGLVTSLSDVAVCVNTADCVPLLLADPVNGVVAAVHAGWRGTVGGIARRAVEVMVAQGAEACNITTAMGPCICSNCFEVGEEVAARFEDTFGSEGVVLRDLGARPHVNLAAALRCSLMRAGVEPGNINDEPAACSRCDTLHYFSARGLGVKSGRTLSGVMLRSVK